MVCEVCGAVKHVQGKYMQTRFRACSRSCAAVLGQRTWPRTSSLEATMFAAFERAGMHPEDQYEIDRATTDFAFPAARLIVECDGSYWHSLPAVKARDQRRDGWLRSLGWCILRLPEADIQEDADRCVAKVKRMLALRPVG
jgi:very-short-patch-repair endonuclease